MHSNVKFVRRDEDIKVNIIRRVVGGITPRTKFPDCCRGFLNCNLSFIIY